MRLSHISMETCKLEVWFFFSNSLPICGHSEHQHCYKILQSSCSVPLWSRIQWSLMYSTSKSIKYNQAQSIKLKVSVQLSTWGEFYAAQLQNFLYKVKMSQIASSHPKAADHPNAAFVLFRLRYLDFLFWYFFFGILMKKNLFMFAYLGSFSVLI